MMKTYLVYVLHTLCAPKPFFGCFQSHYQLTNVCLCWHGSKLSQSMASKVVIHFAFCCLGCLLSHNGWAIASSFHVCAHHQYTGVQANVDCFNECHHKLCCPCYVVSRAVVNRCEDTTYFKFFAFLMSSSLIFIWCTHLSVFQYSSFFHCLFAGCVIVDNVTSISVNLTLIRHQFWPFKLCISHCVRMLQQQQTCSCERRSNQIFCFGPFGALGSLCNCPVSLMINLVQHTSSFIELQWKFWGASCCQGNHL